MSKSIPQILDNALAEFQRHGSVGKEWSLSDELRSLRLRLRLTQEEFADRYAIPIGNLQNWEQASRSTRPDAAARLLIKMIKADPDRVAALVEQIYADEAATGESKPLQDRQYLNRLRLLPPSRRK
jgi:putative transcriptional regulator